jgi:hypothetical protein
MGFGSGGLRVGATLGLVADRLGIAGLGDAMGSTRTHLARTFTTLLGVDLGGLFGQRLAGA